MADVSITTVSLIINDKPCRVSEATREKVLAVAKELNYRPNYSAKALITKRTNTIGLIIPDISNPFFSELAKGIEIEAQKYDYSVIFCNSNSSGKKDLKNLELLISKQIDGIIITNSFKKNDTEYINNFNRLIHSHNLPIVAVDRNIPNKEYDTVILDHREGGFLATCHLLELGHKKIGCITGPTDSSSAADRYQGYLDALSMYKIPFDENFVCQGDYQIESGAACGKKLIDCGVTAIFACNDLMACGAIRQVHIMGKKIGDGLSIIGFDNIPLCEILEQQLTTIHQPVYDMGKSSCELILNLINKTVKKRQVTKFLPTLVKRDTTFKLA